jgi:hypothetical protein
MSTPKGKDKKGAKSVERMEIQEVQENPKKLD